MLSLARPLVTAPRWSLASPRAAKSAGPPRESRRNPGTLLVPRCRSNDATFTVRACPSKDMTAPAKLFKAYSVRDGKSTTLRPIAYDALRPEFRAAVASWAGGICHGVSNRSHRVLHLWAALTTEHRPAPDKLSRESLCCPLAAQAHAHRSGRSPRPTSSRFVLIIKKGSPFFPPGTFAADVSGPIRIAAS